MAQRKTKSEWFALFEEQKQSGLSAIIGHEIGQDAFSGQVFVFYNKNRDKLKVVYGDESRFALLYKRLSATRSRFIYC